MCMKTGNTCIYIFLRSKMLVILLILLNVSIVSYSRENQKCEEMSLTSDVIDEDPLIRFRRWLANNSPGRSVVLHNWIEHGYFTGTYVFQDCNKHKVTIRCLNDSVLEMRGHNLRTIVYPLNMRPPRRPYPFTEKYKYHIVGTNFTELIIDSIIETNRDYDESLPIHIPHKTYGKNTEQFPRLLGDTIYVSIIVPKLRFGKFTFDEE